LRALTDGVVLAKLKEVGEIACRAVSPDRGSRSHREPVRMRAEVDVNEADLERVKMGGSARVTPDAYPNHHYAAGGEALSAGQSPEGHAQGRSRSLSRTKLLPDMSTRVTFFADPPLPGAETPQKAVLVPAGSLQRDNDGSYVWVVADGRVHRANVETAGDAGDRVRVVSGLTGGEAVVVGDATLHEANASPRPARVEPPSGFLDRRGPRQNPRAGAACRGGRASSGARWITHSGGAATARSLGGGAGVTSSKSLRLAPTAGAGRYARDDCRTPATVVAWMRSPTRIGGAAPPSCVHLHLAAVAAQRTRCASCRPRREQPAIDAYRGHQCRDWTAQDAAAGS
jgi:hypothetical protein